MAQGVITTKTGGRVDIRVDHNGRFSWHCRSCGHVEYGTADEVCQAGAKHLQTRAMCAFRN